MSSKEELPRQLGLWDGAAIVIGVVVGGGIFLTPALIAQKLASATEILLVWVLGGLLSFFGALAYAELGAMMPATGGQYVFLREIYGAAWAFVCGWTLFLVILPANIAALAVGFALYLGQFVQFSAAGATVVAVGVILLFTLVNCVGVRAGALVQRYLTVLKLAGAALLVGAAVFSRQPNQLHLGAALPHISAAQFGGAMVACLLTYDGWNLSSFLGGELKRPQRNIPLALAVGLGIVTLLYLSFNAALLHVLPVSVIAASPRVGTVLAERTMGTLGASILSVTILLSLIGSINAGILASPRVYFAQARDGLFFRKFGEVHPRFHTPAFAIGAQGVMAALLAITGSYELLITYAIFCGWVLYVLVVFGVFLLRRREPNRDRPYRMWGYPFTAIAFLLAASLFLGSNLIQSPRTSLVSLLIIAAGLPVYAGWRRLYSR